MADKSSSEQGKRGLRKEDAEALAMIRESGILNPNFTLDEIMSLTEKLETQAQAEAHIFIFKEVVLVDCPF